MTIDLSKIDFSYDFFSSTMPDGSTLVLNNISEAIATNSLEVKVKGINILIIDAETGGNILCSPVIGMGNDRILLNTKHTEYLGKTLNEDNMKYCTIEMLEAEDE